MQLDMVRPGIIMYGLWPSNEVEHKINLKPAMKFKAQVGFIKEVTKETSISYGRTYITNKTSQLQLYLLIC